MKTITLSLTVIALLLEASLLAFAITRPAPLVKGKDHPILLQRMVVTATLLPS